MLVPDFLQEFSISTEFVIENNRDKRNLEEQKFDLSEFIVCEIANDGLDGTGPTFSVSLLDFTPREMTLKFDFDNT